MKILLAVAVVSLFAAGCATTDEPTRLAQAECKVAPITTESATGVRSRNPSSIEQRHAEMQLATSQYRMQNLRTQGMVFNNVEDALRDCR